MPITEMIENLIIFSDRKGTLWVLSLVRHFALPWFLQSMELSRPEYWIEKLFHSPGDFSDSPHIVRLNLRILVFISFEVAFG